MFIGEREVQAQFICVKYDTSYKLLFKQNFVQVIQKSALVRRCTLHEQYVLLWLIFLCILNYAGVELSNLLF